MQLEHYNATQLAVLGWLTVSAVSAVSLAALWTVWGAASRWHWRALALAVLIALLNLAPAEFVQFVFGAQAILILAALGALRAAQAYRRAGFAGWRFGLTDALAVVVYLALMAAALQSVERLPVMAPRAIRFAGGYALLGLLGLWIAVRPWRWWGYLARAGALLAAPLVTVELLDFSSEFLRQSPHYQLGYYYWRQSLGLTWATPLVVAAAASAVPIARASTAVARSSRFRAWRHRVGAVAMATVIAGLALGYAAILNDPGNPQAPLPSPNGYDDVNAAIAGFDKQLPHDSPWQANDAELAAFLKATESVRQRARAALDRPSVARLCGNDRWYIEGRFSERRVLARAWSAEVVAASRRRDIAAMVDSSWAILQLGKNTWNGGTIIHMLIAVQLIGTDVGVLRNSPAWPDDPQLQPLLAKLLEWEHDLDGAETIVARDRLWDRHVDWRSRIQWQLRWFGPPPDRNYESFGPRTVAQVRLLALELALARYRALHGENPDSLERLVPEVLPAVPRDPFDETRPIAYQRKANGYLLYSVGDDGVDNGGNWPQSGIGHDGYDYRLP